ncbi:FAD-binding oxidoreductase [Hazenella sp. IB182353]|uniref:NAD(P)/FAD-dependent oxidoreductase n=1 Tax=Polycladospora coralii TaxID=2771432 RepID=UPI001745F4B6|nr:FAD-dependent oxidoreductase [Polycladospora coralii]MBS7530323.1 FAD-binding oxidoreductase [Polycladospora coralii]
MQLTTGQKIWTKVNPVITTYPYLTEDISTEFVVVGGGITGTITAYALAAAGAKVVLIEKNMIGYGSTSASTSILQYEIDSNLKRLAALYGSEQAIRAFSLCADAVEAIENWVQKLDHDCGFGKVPCLYYSSRKNDKKWLHEEFQLRQKAGFNVSFLDKQSAHDKFSFPIQAAILSHAGSGYIDPYQLSHAMLQLGQKQGLTIYEHTEATQLESVGEGIQITTPNQFTILAKQAIITTGYEAKKLIKQKIASMTRSFVIVTKPQQNPLKWYKRSTIRDTKQAYTYIRTTPDHRIIVGGKDLDLGGQTSKVATLTQDDPLSAKQYDALKKELFYHFPDLLDSDDLIQFQFSGLFADTKDSLPYIGSYEALPHCLFNLGLGGNGILYAVIGAKLLAQQLQGKAPSDLQLFRFDR